MKSISLVLVFVFFQSFLWFGENSAPQAAAIQQNIHFQQEQNNNLLQQTVAVESNIQSLTTPSKDSPALAEDYIRWHLGLIKEGEYFCRW